jgi:small subunit ribosomal protein S11
MGKKRIIRKSGSGVNQGLKNRSLARIPRRKMETATLFVQATYNNTMVTLADNSGNTVMWSSSGSLGFSGAKKGTPFAAAKVGEIIGEKAAAMGIKEVSVVIRGVGSGRESSLRGFTSKGIELSKIIDDTPVPHGGCRPRKPRRI